MDDEEQCTPQKTPNMQTGYRHTKTAQFNCTGYMTPECKIIKIRCESNENRSYNNTNESQNMPAKPKNTVTMMQTTSCSSGISSWDGTNSNALQMLGGSLNTNMAVINTPPAKRYQQRVRNPFEAALAERLHLPLIASPSLFQIPSTPQLSSTQFEWTIDEVSSLQPAHVEPHETQFHDSPDSEYEAKAQMAISSYFKEQQIVPSPVDCPLRNQRIVLSELNGNTPISKPGRRIRDIGTQTDLSLPFELPKELEDMLKQYLQPELAAMGREWRGIGYRAVTKQADSLKDTSLRRKLFDMHNVVILESDGLSPSTFSSMYSVKSERCARATSSSPQAITFVGKLSDSLDKSACGSLSPISAQEGLSFSSHSPTPCSPTRRKMRMRDFGSELSPIVPLTQPQDKRDTLLMSSPCNYRVTNSRSSDTTFADLTARDDSHAVRSTTNMSKHKFSPDRSSSPVPALWRTTSANAATTSAIANYSNESFNVKVSRLAVHNEKSERSVIKVTTESEYLLHDETTDMLDDDDDMQVSQLSVLSSNCSSSNSDTPRKKRRSASRKNLSQSFSASWLQVEEDSAELETPMPLPMPKVVVSKPSECGKDTPTLSEPEHKRAPEEPHKKLQAEQRVNFYRTDSGFNEMTPCTSVLSSQEELSGDAMPCAHAVATAVAQKLAETAYTAANDVSMLSCCSTPTRDL